MPMVTVALAALIGEQITPPFLFGAAVVLGGVYVGAFRPLGPGGRTRQRAGMLTDR